MARITDWRPEDIEFWEKKGKKIASRNLWISIPALLLGFAIWQIWSVVAVKLNNSGFNFTDDELFLLAAVPSLSAATLRIVYSFVVPVFGGRNWTVISTSLLLVPAIGIGIAVQNPETPYITMVILAALTGLGGANFASSMANIGFFYPKRMQGTALGLNGGLGNLGVSVTQFVIPIVTGLGLFGALGGSSQILKNGEEVWLQNAAFIWVIPLVIVIIAAWFGMDNLATAQASLKQQLVIFKRKHMYLLTFLYSMSFGSFIGFSAAFPLVIKSQFPDVNPLDYAFLGPLVGALSRPVGGWLADKLGGAKVTLAVMVTMALATGSVMFFIGEELKSFIGFFLMFMILFITTGIANGSIFRMIPSVFNSPLESSATVGFSSAIAAYGGFVVPRIFGLSISLTGQVYAALFFLIAHYLVSIFVTWYWYARRGAEVRA